MQPSGTLEQQSAEALVKAVVREIRAKTGVGRLYSVDRRQVYDLLNSTLAIGLHWLTDIEKLHLVDLLYQRLAANDEIGSDCADIDSDNGCTNKLRLNQEEVDFIFDMIQG